ncbi:MAG: type I restriction endonuclease subunit R, partial [Nitrosomonas sp.]|nr:type I restriction endonuclease subunit R [Nitrosomonas sp.]
MTKLTESAIEELAIKLFEQLGYSHIHAPDIAPDGDHPERTRYDEVLLTSRLEKALQRINPGMTVTVLQTALKEVERIHSPELLSNNETFHRLLTEGVKVSYQQAGNERGDIVWLIDFENPGNNEFVVASQFTVIENNQNKRPDLVVFVNGIPLVVIELKNAIDENTTIKSAFKQLETYKQSIPSLFTYNALLVISDGLEAKAGSLSAGISRFMTWKTADGKVEASHLVSQLETLIKGMLNKKTLLDLVRHFVVFEQSRKEDPQTGVISISTVKKIAAYHQYYAVNAAVASTLRAADISPDSRIMQSPASYGLPNVAQQPRGDKKAGVVWHTQGSGKSLSMVFYTGKVVLALNNPTILVITDRNDLDDQLFDTFAACKQLLRQEPRQVENRQQLKELLRVASGGVIFTTIQKFQPEEGNVYEELSDRRNIVVIADEAHRTQYGFSAKTIDAKDAQGEVIGKKVVYGFAKYLRDAL